LAENRNVVLKSRPAAAVSMDDFAIVDAPIPVPQDGELLVRNQYLSLDPGIRLLLGSDDGYIPPTAIGAPMGTGVLGTVVQSRAPGFAEGDLVVGRGMVGEYSVVSADTMCWTIDPALCPTPTAALSVLGMTGLPAYFGLLDIGKPQPGETVLVSAAAGAVGSIVGQIAKIKGCRTVGIAGGPEKCRRLVEEFGFDAAIDYKGKSLSELSAAIAEACPDGVDVYFDNVGGMVLDAALSCMNWQGRIAVCGMISGYDGGEAPQMHNLFSIVAKVLTVQGFLMFTYESRFAEAIAEMSGWIGEGRLTYRDEVFEGLEQAIPTFMRLFDGSNQGKTMVKL